MAEYYLISQLPSLDGISVNMPLPITEERFFELCTGLLPQKAVREFKKLTLLPTMEYEKSSSALVESWNSGERDLRLALGKIRAEKMGKSFDIGQRILPTTLLQTAKTAVEFTSPLEAEQFLNQYRLNFLESLRPTDNFSQDYIFYYGLKLKLLIRASGFDAQSGESAYKKIYNSILSGNDLEDIK
jgi:hypothetical protein